MGTDIERFRRLRGAIEAAVTGVSDDHAATAVSALVGAYVALRAEVRAAIDASYREEFDRLFASMEIPAAPSTRRGFDPFASADLANSARINLKTMGGWLGGFIENAEAERTNRG